MKLFNTNLKFDFNRIIAVTFTNKAANEIKERVKKALDQKKGLSIKNSTLLVESCPVVTSLIYIISLSVMNSIQKYSVSFIV